MVRDYLHLHFIVFLWGFTAIIGVLVTIPAVELVFYRTLIASGGILLILLVRKMKVMVSPEQLLRLLLTGFVISAHWILFFASAKVATASISLAGMATATFWTSLLEPLLTKRKIKGFEMLLGLVVIGGLYLIYRFEFDHALGLFMAVGSAFLAALFSVLNAKFVKTQNQYTIAFYEMVGATLFTSLFFPVYMNTLSESGSLQLAPTTQDWWLILALAIVCTVYAFSASVELMKRLTAFAVNLSINLEPVYGITLAFFLLNEEKMSVPFYIGALIIVMAVLSYPVHNYIRKKRALRKVMQDKY